MLHTMTSRRLERPARGRQGVLGQARRYGRPSILAAVALVAGTVIAVVPTSAAMATPAPSLGTNVIVFTPGMPQAAVQAELDTISTQQVPNQFGSQRYAIFFQPGTYGSAANPLIFQIGFYTQVAGLGMTPQDTVINGEALVLNQCSAGACDGTDNFWRSLSNLTINVVTPAAGAPTPVGAVSPPSNDPFGTGCDTSGDLYAASQAMPIRRVIVNGALTLQDYCSPTGFVSGGFIADSEVTGKIAFDGQQQYLVRNSSIGGSSNSVWNMVFSGVNGAPATEFDGTAQYTTLPTSPVTQEEPFLYTDAAGNYDVFLPAVQHNSSGPSWATGSEAGTSVPISRFFIASPSTPVLEMDLAMALGKDLILTPGVYSLRQPIVISRPGTVVMGLGFATLVPEDGTPAVVVIPNRGVKVCGLIVDAGPVSSPVLFSVGTAAGLPISAPGATRAPGAGAPGAGTAFPGNDANDPDLVQDVFFRIGGAELGKANISLLDEANNSIIDDVWAWRADHGNPGTVGWTVNTGGEGAVITGNDVTAYGLAVEHYQRNEVVWSGQNGTLIFFQNENPYDPPTQSSWMATPNQNGYPAFLLAQNVTTFQGYGMGSYSFFDLGVPIFSSEAFEAPNQPGDQFHDILTVFLNKSGSGGISSVINGTGGSSTIANPDTPVDVVNYT